ncbi:MAG: hypothetical protein JNL58_30650 [Planctomyces sp.]|nr:hypothetical protein [Planctomyces sp.]
MKWVFVVSLLILVGGSFRLASQYSQFANTQQTDVLTRDVSVNQSRLAEQLVTEPAQHGVFQQDEVPVPVPEPVPVPDVKSAASRRGHPVRHPAALHESMITPGNFEYLGGFRPPSSTDDEHTFSYGGWGIAWRPDGDPDGAKDGYPGSLYLVGHQQSQEVAEISIPKPVVSADDRMDDLPVSEILQPFHDVTSGLMARMNVEQTTPFNIGGLQVTQGVLHWTIHKYYNVDGVDYPSHGVSPLRAFEWSPAGPWHLGPMRTGSPEWHSYKHAGYIFEVPESEAKEWFGGRNLISGLQISTGLQASSQGPAMFSYQLPERGTPAETSLSAVPLVWYSQQQPLVGHHPADRWSGGAWLTLGDKQAVVIVGRKALGEFYYGEPRPQDCSPYKGYHGPPYEFQMLFYSPASLIHAAHGSLRAESVEPWLRWDSHFEGGGPGHYIFPSCGQDIGGMTYDRERNLLYIVQVNAGHTSDNEYELLPVIHVFRIAE